MFRFICSAIVGFIAFFVLWAFSASIIGQYVTNHAALIGAFVSSLIVYLALGK